MQSYKIYRNLAWLNDLSAQDAEAMLLDCCGSRKWAERMAAERPFRMLEDLYVSAETIWFSLTPSDWIEAFTAHPKIGATKAPASASSVSAEWSAGEQRAVDVADAGVMEQLAEANRLYEEKFGFIFIVCATGKSAEEMLAICRTRIRNSGQTEIQIAAHQQYQITELRLNKILER